MFLLISNIVFMKCTAAPVDLMLIEVNWWCFLLKPLEEVHMAIIQESRVFKAAVGSCFAFGGRIRDRSSTPHYACFCLWWWTEFKIYNIINISGFFSFKILFLEKGADALLEM